MIVPEEYHSRAIKLVRVKMKPREARHGMSDESTDKKIKFMFGYTMIASLVFGIMMLAAPSLFVSLQGWPEQDLLIFGVVASVFTAEGLVSIIGFKKPRAFAPILLFQMTYKIVWFAAVVLPMAITSTFYIEALAFAIILATFVVGDLIALPFKELLNLK